MLLVAELLSCSTEKVLGNGGAFQRRNGPRALFDQVDVWVKGCGIRRFVEVYGLGMEWRRLPG
jgi:hypothetical protein